jgi:hypothetical protein
MAFILLTTTDGGNVAVNIDSIIMFEDREGNKYTHCRIYMKEQFALNVQYTTQEVLNMISMIQK